MILVILIDSNQHNNIIIVSIVIINYQGGRAKFARAGGQ